MREPWPSRKAVVAGLVLANAVPLVGVLGFGWDLHSLLVGYWLESGAVGVASIAKIRRAEGDDDPSALPSVSFNDRSVQSFVGKPNRHVAWFVGFHYGAFWVVHGIFVFAFPVMFRGLTPASPEIVGLAVVGLVGYHAVSYRINYVDGREFERTGPVTLMVEPYRRVLVLHVTILFGATVIAVVGAPVGALAVMVLAKTVLDLRGHWKEHGRVRRRLEGSTRSGTDR
jgi:hypothetical protein